MDNNEALQALQNRNLLIALQDVARGSSQSTFPIPVSFQL